MNIAIVIDLIHTGGAETFVLRLAKALKERGHNVHLFLFYKSRNDHNLISTLAPGIPVHFASIPLLRFFEKTDTVLRMLKIDFSFVRFFIKRSFSVFLRKEKIEVIHSHLFTADFIAVTIKKLPCSVVSTMHGDYEFYNAELKAGRKLRILGYKQKELFVLKRLHRLVYITEQQFQFLSGLLYFNSIEDRLVKIYNGYPLGSLSTNSKINESFESFVIGMVSRGVKEKGWEVLVKAFIEAAIPNSTLKLVGGGDFIDYLKDKYRQYHNISFIGKALNPVEYIKTFDVACLPSLFTTESLPTVLIEYLICGKPVIASRVGEIPLMLGDNTDFPCGILITQAEEANMITELKEALLKLYNDRKLYLFYAENTREAIEKFDMNVCVEKYEDVYRSSLRKKISCNNSISPLDES